MNIVLYTPYLQGFYIGELVNQIRQLCQLKSYSLTIIRTGTFSTYNTRLGLCNVDGVIVIREAIASDLMEFIVKSKIACVSIAYDYFPLDIPVLTSNHQLGIKIAFDHLESHTVSNIAFIGEISQYDQRKRLEYYTQEIESRGYEFIEDNIINTNSSLIEGGQLAAERFLEKNGSADGIIFSAGLVGIGFVQHMQTLNPEKLEQLSLICFDAIPLIPVLAPQLAAVDQNLHLIAYRAINRLEKNADTENRKILVDPKLTKLYNDEAIDFDPFLTTCVEMAELYTPGYMKSVIANQHDLPREIAESELDTIASLSTLFPNFFCCAQALRYHRDQKGKEWVKLFKNMTRNKLEKLPTSDKASLLPLTEYQPSQKMASKPRCSVYVPIYVEQRLWGFLLVFGEPYDQYDKSSFLSFTAFLDEIVVLYHAVSSNNCNFFTQRVNLLAAP